MKANSGIQKRIDDALFLWKNERCEGAFLSALIALAAAARKRYPAMKDNECFEQFLRDCHSVKLRVEYRGECRPIEQIFYKWLRCQLVHEAELPVDIQFMGDNKPGQTSIRAGGAPEYVLKIGYGWFHHIIKCVMESPEYAGHSHKK